MEANSHKTEKVFDSEDIRDNVVTTFERVFAGLTQDQVTYWHDQSQDGEWAGKNVSVVVKDKTVAVLQYVTCEGWEYPRCSVSLGEDVNGDGVIVFGNGDVHLNDESALELLKIL